MIFSKRSLEQVLIGVGVVALVGAAASVLSFLLAEDGDRPPIIVSNGSVHVELAQHGGNGKRGKLTKDKNRWYHDYEQKWEPKSLELLVTGVDPAANLSCSPSSTFFAQKVGSATINFKYPDPNDNTKTINGKLTFTLDKDQHQKGAVQFTGDLLSDSESQGDHAVVIGKNLVTSLTSVAVSFTNSAGESNSTTCTFKDSVPAMVAILQRKN